MTVWVGGCMGEAANHPHTHTPKHPHTQTPKHPHTHTRIRSPPLARILVVDDEEDVRAALQRRLEREGHHVTPASSASDASTLLHSPQDSYDLVLSDMSMEEGDSG